MQTFVVAALALAAAVCLSAAAPMPAVGGVCNGTSEYCCPDAKHCLKPTNVSCLNNPVACDKGQVCCPLTKLCVIPDAPCVSPCKDQGSYCELWRAE